MPTLNRPLKVRSTIQALLPQLTETVSITILDNDSVPPITHQTIGCCNAAKTKKYVLTAIKPT
jgi:hypothetical protein